jgi:secondary thiamine-phosphate synthase enzyme
VNAVAAGLRQHREDLVVATRGRGVHPIDGPLQALLARSGLADGVLHAWCRHASFSLGGGENAGSDVCADRERWFARAVPDGDALLRHDAEGRDGMPAHVRSVLTASGLSIRFRAGRVRLGTWQGVFRWQHHQRPRDRRITVPAAGH